METGTYTDTEMDNHSSETETLIDNYKAWLKETRPERLKEFMGRSLEQCEFQVLNFTEHYFKPHGYTGLWLLGESHLAIHTFPEKGLCYVELSSCNAAKNKKFKSLLTVQFSLSDSE